MTLVIMMPKRMVKLMMESKITKNMSMFNIKLIKMIKMLTKENKK